MVSIAGHVLKLNNNKPVTFYSNGLIGVWVEVYVLIFYKYFYGLYTWL